MKKSEKLLRAARVSQLLDCQQVSRRNKLNKKLRHLLANRVVNIKIYFKIDTGDIKGVVEQLVMDNNGSVNHNHNND
jgi:hypothetical protein